MCLDHGALRVTQPQDSLRAAGWGSLPLPALGRRQVRRPLQAQTRPAVPREPCSGAAGTEGLGSVSGRELSVALLQPWVGPAPPPHLPSCSCR